MKRYRLIDHPFYQAWNEGKITLEQLSEYAKSYLQIIENIPVWWEKILQSYHLTYTNFSFVVAEEKYHIPLWLKWTYELPEVKYSPKMNDVIEKLNNMEPSELLGAIHSFEVQQPEVAKLKKEVLMKYYHFKNEKLEYFDEHINEKEHIEITLFIAENYADKKKFNRGKRKGSKIFYEALDKFL